MNEIVIAALIVCLLYMMYLVSCTNYHLYLEKFVAFNSYKVPNDTNTNSNFDKLFQTIDTTNYHISYDLDNILSTFQDILGKQVTILSVGDTKPFTLYNVTLQDSLTFAITRLTRVDFIVDSLNPYVIKKVFIQKDPNFTSTEFVLPIQQLQDDTRFRIKNDLHLFEPYDTSANELKTTKDDSDLLLQIIKDKKKILLENF